MTSLTNPGQCSEVNRVRKPKAKRWKRSDVALELRRAAQEGDEYRIDSTVRGFRQQFALEDAIGSHACLQPIQQWVTEFMVSVRGCRPVFLSE
jgi:hypothetical protein